MRIKLTALIAILGCLGATHSFAQIQTNVFAGPLAFMNVFLTDGSPDGSPVLSEGGYQFGSAWALPDLTAVTTDNVSFVVSPNTSAYANAISIGTTNELAYWTNSDDGGLTAGDDGNKWMEHSLFYERIVSAGMTSITFNVTVDANTLSNRYQQAGFEPVLYVKVLDRLGGGWQTIPELSSFQTITTSGVYNVVLDDSILPTVPVGQWLQAGITYQGLNANPADDWGSIGFTINELTLVSDSDTPTPDPTATAVVTDGTNVTITSSVATDANGVEYQLRRLDNGILPGFESEWQTNTTWMDLGPLGPSVTGNVEIIEDPDFQFLSGPIAPNGPRFWEGWNAQTTSPFEPFLFVSVAGGVATVSPENLGAFNVYQTWGAPSGDGNQYSLNRGQTYIFTVDSLDGETGDAADGDMTVESFVKFFNGDWQELAEDGVTTVVNDDVTDPNRLTQQHLFDNTTVSIEFVYPTNEAVTIAQIGVWSWRDGGGPPIQNGTSYRIANPGMLGENQVSPGPPIGLPVGQWCYQVRARDFTALQNTTPWSVADCVDIGTLISSLTLDQNGSGDMVLTWAPTVADQSYRVESKGSLSDPWPSVSAIPGVDGSMSVTNPAGAAEFFRVSTE